MSAVVLRTKKQMLFYTLHDTLMYFCVFEKLKIKVQAKRTCWCFLLIQFVNYIWNS